LSRHFAEGRLDQAEFKERLDKAMGATTGGDLAGLFDDLPRLGNESATHPRRRRLIPFLVIIALAVLAASWTVSTVHLPFLVFVGVGLFLWLRAGRRRTHHAEIDR
jgi:Flp pilus assembly protein TadB